MRDESDPSREDDHPTAATGEVTDATEPGPDDVTRGALPSGQATPSPSSMAPAAAATNLTPDYTATLRKMIVSYAATYPPRTTPRPSAR